MMSNSMKLAAGLLAAIVAGEIQMVADPMTTSLVHIEAGKLQMPVSTACYFDRLKSEIEEHCGFAS